MQYGDVKFVTMTLFSLVVGLCIVLAIIFLTAPYQLGANSVEGGLKINLLNIIGVYIGIFLFFSGLFSTIFFFFRRKNDISNQLYFSAVTSFRQGILMGILVCNLLFMQSFNMLIWWDAILIVIAIILIEMYLAVK